MNINLRLMSSFFTICVLAGCAGTAPRPISHVIDHQENLKTEPTHSRLVEPATKVVGNANDVKVREIRTQTINGHMIVDYILYNDRGRRDVINYRVRWLDPNGMMVSQYDPWETVSLEGHEQSVLSITAPTLTATNFIIELKPNQ